MAPVPVAKQVKAAAERWWACITPAERKRLNDARMKMNLARARFETLNQPLVARYDAIKDSLPQELRVPFMRYVSRGGL